MSVESETRRTNDLLIYKDLLGGEGPDLLKGTSSPDHLDGGGGNDQIYGGDNKDELYGGEGDDYLKGGRGSDILYGGDGNDEIHGSAGKDQLYGGAGDDHLGGGKGADQFFFSEEMMGGTDTIGDFNRGQGDTLVFDIAGLDIGDLSQVGVDKWGVDLTGDGSPDAYVVGEGLGTPQYAYDQGYLIL
jgi:Ca2+-binding RTX toxin-like protein